MGDALGAPVEFLTLSEIKSEVGDAGVTEVLPPGHFTDDTQMILFTCAGLLDASMRFEATGTCHPTVQVYDAYLAWLATQGDAWDSVRRSDGPSVPSPYLWSQRALHRREAPGMTCLAALRSGTCGRLGEPINDSKGCGGVMRAAPAGFLIPGVELGTAPGEAYHLGCEIAAITHGHRLGIHPSGLLAAIIHRLCVGSSIDAAIDETIHLAPDDLASLIVRACDLGRHGPPAPADIATHLGGGWVGEEALAIAVACSIAAPDIATGLLASVNHSGDSDSTGALAGNLLGAAFGRAALPAAWLDDVDALAIVDEVASDVVTWVVDRPPADEPDEDFARLFARYVA